MSGIPLTFDGITTKMKAFSRYSKEIQAIFEIVGNHFVDTIYNSVYRSVWEYEKSKGPYDNFRIKLTLFVNNIRDDEELYKRVIAKLYEVFKIMADNPTITFQKFNAIITKQFFPENFHEQLTNEQHLQFVRKVVNFLLSSLRRYILSEPGLLEQIVDDYDKKHEENILMLKDCAIVSLFALYEQNYNKLSIDPADGCDKNLGMATDLHAQIMERDKTIKSLERTIRGMKIFVQELQDEMSEKEERESKLIRIINMVRNEYQTKSGDGDELPTKKKNKSKSNRTSSVATSEIGSFDETEYTEETVYETVTAESELSSKPPKKKSKATKKKNPSIDIVSSIISEEEESIVPPSETETLSTHITERESDEESEDDASIAKRQRERRKKKSTSKNVVSKDLFK
jgi:hypothetical protein